MKQHYVLLLSFLLLANLSFSQKKLEQSKSELKAKNEPKSASPSGAASNDSPRSGSSSVSSDDDDDTTFLGVFIDAIWGVFKYGIIGDYENENHLESSLSPYPFYNKRSGNFEQTDADSLDTHGRIDIEDHFIYSYNKLYGNHLKVKARPFQYFYFQGEWHQLFESNKIEN